MPSNKKLCSICGTKATHFLLNGWGSQTEDYCCYCLTMEQAPCSDCVRDKELLKAGKK